MRRPVSSISGAPWHDSSPVSSDPSFGGHSGRSPRRGMAGARPGGDVEQVLYVIAKSLEASGKREHGQTMAEYAAVLAVTAIAVVAAITALSGGISGALNTVTSLV
jgi:Flp pilus assembly pilin Flp